MTETTNDNLLIPCCVIPSLSSKKPEDAIREIVDGIRENPEVLDADKLVSEIIARERGDSTAIGLGVAIPHARTDAVRSIVFAVGRSAKGVAFKSKDGKPAHLLLLIGAPVSASREYLSYLAALTRMVRRDDIRRALISANTAEEIQALLRAHFSDRNGSSSHPAAL